MAEIKGTKSSELQEKLQEALDDMGIFVQAAAGVGVQRDKSFLINLNPSKNELLVYYLKEVTRVGSEQPTAVGVSTPYSNIQLHGPDIAPGHCVFEITDKDVFLTPLARTLVNGDIVTERAVSIKHGDRILFGNDHLFHFHCPWQQDDRNTSGELVDYAGAKNGKELQDDPMNNTTTQEELVAGHDAEKEGSLDAQRVKYEEQLSKLREQLAPSDTTPTPPTLRYTTPEQWEECSRERLVTTVQQANRLVQEANALAQVLHRDTSFRVTLTIPRYYLSPQLHTLTNSEEMNKGGGEVAIRVLHRQRRTDSVWSVEALKEKVIVMRDIQERMEDEGSQVDETLGPDPFYDLEQHTLLGVANFFLGCLRHEIAHEYTAPIVASTGSVCGHLKVAIQRVPTHVPYRDPGGKVSQVVGLPEVCILEDSANLRPGVTFSCQISVIEASGLPKEYSHYVFCQYQFWNEKDPLIIPPLVQLEQEESSNRLHRFEYSQVFTVEVTEEFLSFVDNRSLGVEVWGHRRSGFLDVPKEVGGVSETEGVGNGRQESFPENSVLTNRWSELTQRLELWVEMMELSDGGEYVPVEVQSRLDVTTGGVFMIRPGQPRRISVFVCTVPGSGDSSLECGSVSSVSIGSVCVRDRQEGALDSYQSHDLERLRKKWSDAILNRRQYLDTEMRKIMDKREPSASDLERQNELLDQWATLQWQRAALLQPKAGSRVPGAPTTSSQMVPGFESRVPVLFLDPDDDLLTSHDGDRVGVVSTGVLFEEKEETMVELPLIERNDSVTPQATASWDATVHNTNCLNKVTGNNDRVYAILKVGVALTHPPGVELVLRKRICLQVYKKSSFGSLMKAFSSKEQHIACGVMYEVVTGIPKSEGVQSPLSISTNPSSVEFQEDEVNAVVKFKTALTSISRILTLDQLKQEVALRETLARRTKLQSQSRVDSGTVDHPSGSKSTESSEPKISPEDIDTNLTVPTPTQTKGSATVGVSMEEREELRTTPEDVLNTVDTSTVKEASTPIELSTPTDKEVTTPIKVDTPTVKSLAATEEKDQTSVTLEPQTPSDAKESPVSPTPSHSSFDDVFSNKSEETVDPKGQFSKVNVAIKARTPTKKRSYSQSDSAKVKRTRSTLSTGSESIDVAESSTSAKPPRPLVIGEKVTVEASNGLKVGVVKYIGETKFQPGEWVGVALDRPSGKHNGTVKGVRYFKCKENHGVFVRPEKVTTETSGGSPLTRGRIKSTSHPTSARKGHLKSKPQC